MAVDCHIFRQLHKALPETKTGRQLTGRGKASNKVILPEKVIPLETDDFKDFLKTPICNPEMHF